MRPGPLFVLLSSLSLSLAAAPAALAADPPAKVKKPAGKKPAKVEEPPPEEKPAPKPPVEAPKAVEPAKAPEPEPATAWAHEGTGIGGGLLLGAVLNSSPDTGYKLISPEIGAQFIVDTVISGPLYFRFEPTLSTFSRKASRSVVISAAGPKTDPDTGAITAASRIVKEDLTNKTRVFEIVPRLLLGYDFTPMFSARLGVILGVSLASTSVSINETASEECQSVPLRSGLVYGAVFNPLTARFASGKQAFEVGLVVGWSKRSTPSCDRPVGDSQLKLYNNEEATVSAKVSTAAVTTLTMGVQAAFLTW